MSKKVDIEIPLGKRTFKYRFFEILPAFLSFGAIILMFILSAFSPFLASLYLLTIITTLLVKAIGIAYRMITGHLQIEKAQKVDWNKRLNELENAGKSLDILKNQRNNEYEFKNHLQNLNDIIKNPASFPKPSNVKNAVIIAAYNEPYEVIQPTIQSVLVSNYDAKNLLIFLAYEERGGEEIEKTAIRLKKEFSKSFGVFEIVKHPKNLPNEVVGKGWKYHFCWASASKILRKQ